MPESKALLRIDKGICYVSDLAEWLDVSEDTARRVLDETGVEPVREGNRHLYDVNEVVEAMRR